MNPYISWAIVLVVAGGLGWYYTNGEQPKGKVSMKPVAEKAEAALASKKPKRKVRKAPEPSSKPADKVDEKPAVVESQGVDTEQADEEIDRAEMARRLAAVRNGTFAVPSTAGSNGQKKKKAAAAAAASRLESGSTTGADADDDLSPAGSPILNATVPAAGAVSDMLEKPAPGASVLRVTGTPVEATGKKSKSQSPKPVETKKQRQQRQQRQKNEERKQQVQEAEEARRKLLEKQLHTARESERREAARSKAAPVANAWAAKSTAAPAAASNGNGITTAAQPIAPVDLLDTFDREATSTQAPAPISLAQGLPSEEEQIRLLGVTGESDWTTVSAKKVKKKGGKSDDSVSVSETSASESQPAPTSTPQPVELPQVSQVYIPDILRSTEKRHPLDSDWAA